MRSENILSADILDLIFENRNKSYGAYTLRRHYNARLVKALGITFFFATAILLVAVFIKKEKVKEIFIADTYVIKVLPPVLVESKKKPVLPAPPKQTTKPKATQEWVSKVVITPNDADASKLSKNLDSVAIGNSTLAGVLSDKALVKEPGAIETGTGKIIEATARVEKESPHLTADVMPVFPGGMEALRKFLQRNLQNPEDMDEGSFVEVKIKFVVGYDGKLKAFETIKDGGTTFNNEVIRVLKRMPEWMPGVYNGQKVSVYYTIPVKFTAAD